jgi:glyoxylase-like metal-dependent hydrolase (beta-lactamase superfamily II)
MEWKGRFARTRGTLLLALLWAPGPLLADEPLFDLKPLADGVYAAIAKPKAILNCNALVVVLQDGVLVVDTHSKPSAARGLIDQIKTVTDKPVRYVVNTHFHWDHNQGNAAYLSAWPGGVEVISSEATAESVERRGIPRIEHEIATRPKEIERLRRDAAAAKDPAARLALETQVRETEGYVAELKNMQMTLPTMTFDHNLVLRRGPRTVLMLFLGKAHTDGDVFVLLPKEKILASGDALQGWMPYMGDGYPYDWIRTLEEAQKLDFEMTVGGHGDVLRGNGQFDLWRTYLQDLMAETARVYAKGATLEEARSRVADALTPRYQARFLAAGLPADSFGPSLTGNIEKAYRVVSGQQN